MCDNLRIRLAFHRNTLLFQIVLQFFMIFDNSIVNNRNCSDYVRVGMRIEIAGLPMRCPARMTNSKTTCQLFRFQYFFKLAELAARLFDMQPALFIQNSDARTVIASV